jgi:predicted metalloenzyme YecM
MTSRRFKQEFDTFISTIQKRFKKIGFSLSTYPIDHICYRITTQKEFEEITDFLKGSSTLFSEKVYNDRIFRIFLLKVPLIFEDVEIQVVEISQPGGSDTYQRGFQHIELLTNDSWHDTGLEDDVIEELATKSIYDDKIYLKWEDKIVVKATRKPVLVQALTEDDPEIVVL